MDAAVAQEVSYESAAQKLLDLVAMATPGSRAAKEYRLEFMHEGRYLQLQPRNRR